MQNVFKIYKTPLLFAIISIALYLSFAYDLQRNDFLKLITLYAALFIITYLLIEKFKTQFWILASLGVVFRLLFIVAIPNLSQDFYRFLWDGRIILGGFDPYLFTPNDSFIKLAVGGDVPGFSVAQSPQLLKGMGELSAGHFSNYPPVNQFIFTLSALIAGKSILGSVIVLRVIIILADVGILFYGRKLLKKLKLPLSNIFWYFLNPFIILELTGNLHFEGVMLFLLLWALYLLFKRKWKWSAVLIGISISVKLIPLLFLPLFLKFFNNKQSREATRIMGFPVKKLAFFYLLVALTVFITFLPFLTPKFLHNYSSTIGLWFQNFEFNASVYYIIRWLGFQIVGWNIIGTAGKILPVITLVFILGISFLRENKRPKQLFTAMLWAISFYFLLSTTVHPWYIATPLLISVFTKYKFPIVWSFVVMLSYSAYGKDGVEENLWLVTLEYVVVIGVATWELYYGKDKTRQLMENWRVLSGFNKF